jgi:hypothetical protein
VPHQRVEDVRHPGEQRVGPAGVGQRHRDAGDRLAVGAVDHPALVDAEGADAVAGAEEGQVAHDDLVQQPRQLRLDPVLDGGLVLGRVAGVERPATEEHPGVVVEVQRRQRPGLQADPPQLVLLQAGGAEEGGVLVVRGLVLGPRGQQEEGPHGRRC